MEAKSIIALLGEATQLDSDIIERLAEWVASPNYSERDALLLAREHLTKVINELLKAK